jgi:hypothetical protein
LQLCAQEVIAGLPFCKLLHAAALAALQCVQQQTLDVLRAFAGTNKCNCSDLAYTPVCGKDGYTYSSPCQAACLKIDLAYQGACNKGEGASRKVHVQVSAGCSCHVAAVQASNMNMC